jgi:signal transduction histidine kinase
MNYPLIFLLLLSLPISSEAICPFTVDTELEVGVVGELGLRLDAIVHDFGVRVGGLRYTTLTGTVASGTTDPPLSFLPSCRASGVNVTVVPSFASGAELTRLPVVPALSSQVARLIEQDTVVSLLGPSWTEASHFVSQMWGGPEPDMPILSMDLARRTAALEGALASLFAVFADTPVLRDVRAIGVIYSTTSFGSAILGAVQSYASREDDGIALVAEIALGQSTDYAEVLQLAKATGLRVFVVGIDSVLHQNFFTTARNVSMTSNDGYTYVFPSQMRPIRGNEEVLYVEEEVVNVELFDHVKALLDPSDVQFTLHDVQSMFPESFEDSMVTEHRCFVYDEVRALLVALNSTIEQGYDPRTVEGTAVLSEALEGLKALDAPACLSSRLEFPPKANHTVFTMSPSLQPQEVFRGDAAPYETPRLAFTPDTCVGGRLFRRPTGARTLDCELCPVGTFNLPDDGLEVCSPCTDDTVLLGDTCQFCPPPALARPGPDGYPICVDQVDTSVIVIVCLIAVLVIGAGLVYLRSRSYAREVAHREELAQEKADSMARFTSMLALVSHELRTPLQVVTLHLDMMTSTDPTEAKRIRSVQRSCEWLSSVVSTILDACKLNAGILELSPWPVCLRALMHECVDMARPKLGSKQIVLFADVGMVGEPSETIMVNTDAPRLKQVVLNLLFNAAKYTSSGYIELFVRYDPAGDTTIRVTDTGPGIPKTERAQLFEQFTQAESVTTNVLRGGTGLGLYIAKAVLDLMEGDIEYRTNSSAATGSTFEVTVPLPPAPSPSTTPLAITTTARGPLVVAVGTALPVLADAYTNCISLILPTAKVVQFSKMEEYRALVTSAAGNSAYLLVLADDGWVGNHHFLDFSAAAHASVLHLSLLDLSLCDRHWGKKGPTIGCVDHHVDAVALKLLIHAWTVDEVVTVASRGDAPLPRKGGVGGKKKKAGNGSGGKKRNQ